MTASALYQTGYQPGPDRRRLLAFVLVVLLHILLVALLLLLAPPQPPKKKTEPSVFTMLPDLKPAPKPEPRAKKTEGAKASKPIPAAKAPAPKPPPAPPTADAKPFDLGLMESVDISKLPNHKADSAGAGETGTGPDSETAYGPGAGPGGERLYNAEWQREPTHAELAYYLPHGAPSNAWAIIACRTIEKFRVEDCREVSEYPGGLGLAHALTLAAWQFRVRPPRVGGKTLVGSWVSIRFNFSDAPDGGGE